MKRTVYGLIAVAAALLWLQAAPVQAQAFTPVQTWGFETALENWGAGGGTAAALTAEKAAAGAQSVKLTKNASGLEINLQNDVYEDFKKGDQFSFQIWVAAADKDKVNGVQVFWQTGSGWSWNSIWINGSDLTGDAWTSFAKTVETDVALPLMRVGIQILFKSGNEAETPTVYIDDIAVSRPPAPNFISMWGKNGNATAWPILNTAATPAGDAGIGNGAKPTGWSSIRGGFAPLTATTEQALVITGRMELVGGGGGAGYTHLRYALTFIDSTALTNQNTDSAKWVETGKLKHFGYEFCPRSGTGTVSNGAWGVGTEGIVKNGNWNSTNSNGGPAFGTTLQAPRNAEMAAGVYNWAISVQPLAGGGNEIRWYMVKDDNKYWYGGTVVDTSAVTAKFNAISFGFNSDQNATQVNFNEVQVALGEPITVPEAPWEPFYVNQWGKNGNATAWPILNDATFLDGDAGIGNGAKPTGWSSIRGGFDAVELRPGKALIVTGQMELVGGGGGAGYTHLRYALTYIDSTTLQYQYTDSAKWKDAVLTKHFGYEFCPRSGTGTVSNGAWGVGTEGIVKNGNWNSTNSNGGPAFGTTLQAPRNAEMTAGLYNWGICVEPLAGGGNELRWYMVKDDNKYWYGGTVVDTSAVTTKFNAISFGFNSDQSATQVNFYAVQVDMGEPFTVPTAPWEPFYVSQWGFIGGRTGGFTFIPDDFEGNAAISGTAPATGWAVLRGGFPEPVKPTVEKALVVTGKMEFTGGGFESWASLRFGVFYGDSAGTLDVTPPAESHWMGTENRHWGYLFLPPSGTNTTVAWQGIGLSGTIGAVVNRPWISTNGANDYVLGSAAQVPAGAVAGAGVYDFALSVQPQADGTVEVRVMVVNADSSYMFVSKNIDSHSPVTTDKFNCVAFGVNNGTTTGMALRDILVDMGDPIALPAWVTAVEMEPAAGSVPKTYAMVQNYPNPFNPTTTISFALPKSSDVNLTVFDMAGRVAAELAMGKFGAGVHKVVFDASKLSSGTYIIRLKAGEFTSVKKAVLMK
ncbi:MAG: T9SS type A sorting domain-containing protein [bacterium]|nr:T9SS type A sorting domain-containing protein [bacterium]